MTFGWDISVTHCQPACEYMVPRTHSRAWYGNLTTWQPDSVNTSMETPEAGTAMLLVLWRTAERLPGAYPSLLLWSKAAPQPHIWLTWLYGCRNSVWLKEQHYTNNHIIKSSVLIELWLYKSSKWSLTGLMDKIEPNQICLWILQCRVSFMWSGSDHS